MEKIENKNLKGKLFDIFINYVILISILQIFFEDFAILKGYEIKIKIILLFIGFVVDLIFSIEFIIRSILSIKNKSFTSYFIYQYGWIDFLCSIPLLIMNSIPSVFLYLTAKSIYKNSIGFIKIIRLIRAIRITRILRILRVLKILKNLQNASSKMAQNHMSQILVIFIISLLLSLIGYSLISDFSLNKMVEKQIETYQFAFLGYNQIINDYYINSKYDDINQLLLKIKNIFMADSKILSVEIINLEKEIEDQIKLNNLLSENFLYKSENYQYLYKNFSNTEIIAGYFKINFSTQYYENLKISIELLVFISIIFGTFIFIFIYLKTFVSRISDVIYVIFKGIKNKDYFLMVKIPEKYRDEEIFEFAKFYNDIYLPAKRKMYKKEEQRSKISLDDLLNMDFK